VTVTEKYEQEERDYSPYNPKMIVALLFYADWPGIYNYRKMMQVCEE